MSTSHSSFHGHTFVERLLIRLPMSVLIVVHFTVAGLMLGVLSHREALMLLYASNILLLMHVYDFSITKLSQRRRHRDRRPKRLRHIECEPKVAEDGPNLFIAKWKRQNLTPYQDFPLDRLAFLNAKFYKCPKTHFFYLRNAQLKQLTRKSDCSAFQQHDAPHPARLVTDLFSSYIHRRAMFYRTRKVYTASERQYTKRVSRSEVKIVECKLYPFNSKVHLLERGVAANTRKKVEPKRWFHWKLGRFLYDATFGKLGCLYHSKTK